MTAHVTVYMLMNRTDFEEGKAKTMADFDQLEAKGATSGSNMGEKFVAGFATHAKGFGGLLSSIGNEMNNLGIPFGNVLTKMGTQISGATTKVDTLKESLMAVGKISLFAGLAGGAAVVGEGLKTWDAYEKQLIAVDTVVKNTGGNVDAFNKRLGSLDTAAAHVGYTNTDVASAMANLTMATGSQKKAFDEMGLAENLAAYKNVPLAQATDALDHIFGGSTRTLLSWGINLNVSSGRLHSLQEAEEGVQSAQLALSQVQARHNQGMIEGIQYTTAYQSALLKLQDAHINLNVAETTTSRVLTLLSHRVMGDAEARAKTFAGQLLAARATLHNFSTDVGHDAVDAIEKLEVILGKTIDFFTKFKAAAIALGAIVGGPIVAGVFLYLWSVISRLGVQLLTVGGRVNTFGLQARAQSAGPNALSTAVQRLNSQLETLPAQTESADVALSTTGTTAQAAATQLEALQLSFEDVDDQAQGTLFSIEAFNTSLDPGTVAAADAAGAAIETLTTVALPVIGVLAAAVGILANNWDQASDAASRYAAQVQSMKNTSSEYGGRFSQAYSQGQFGAAQYDVNQQRRGLGAEPWGYKEELVGTGPTLYGPRGGSGKRNEHEARVKVETIATKEWIAAMKQVTEEQNKLNAAKKAWGDMDAKQRADWIKQQTALYDLQNGILNESYTSPAIPKIGKTPGVPKNAGGQTPQIVTSAESMIESFQSALETGTIQSLKPELTGGGLAKEQQERVNLLKDGYAKLANELISVFKQAQAYYGALEANQQRIALADEVQAQAEQMTDQTAIVSAMAAKVVQSIQDAMTVTTAQVTKQADLVASQAQTQADILGERGLYGLNLVTQEMKVDLDRMTQRYQQAEDRQSIVVAQTAKQGDAAVNAAKIAQAEIAKKYDKVVEKAQKREDLMMAGGTSLQQAYAESGLKLAESQQTKAEAIAARAYTQAQDIANKRNALAQRQLEAIQNAAKINEAKQNALIAIEQAKANTEFAGSGVHIEITGINPTDANAVASATSWAMRTKVPK